MTLAITDTPCHCLPQKGARDDLYDDLGEAVTTFEEIERIARRVLGGAHPTTRGIEQALQQARDALRTRA